MKKYVRITSLLLIVLLMLQIILPVITNIEISTSYASTLEYRKSVKGRAYSASILLSSADRYWSTSTGYDENFVQNFGSTIEGYVPLFENIYLTKGSIVEFDVSGNSCQHKGCTADVYISNASSSNITYNHNNQTNKVGTLEIPKGSHRDSVTMQYKINTTGYYTADAMGVAYGCSAASKRNGN